MAKSDLTALLLEWYNRNGRSLPWRVKGSAHPDPYVILVSEFMLQQTTVKTVIPYFQRFMQRFPTIEALAAATQEEVYLYWQGLGYYSRARSLHHTAQMIVEQLAGRFPQTRADILKLKGIGPYTAASILALAFNLPETVIDGNVIRVISRLYHLTAPTDELMDTIRFKAAKLTSKQNPADYASAIMDLGAVVCTPKNPQCLICPWQQFCQSAGRPDVEDIPLRRKLQKKTLCGHIYLITNARGEIYLRRRDEKGLLSGLYEFPWHEEKELFVSADNSGLQVTHIFTHIRLTLQIHTLTCETPQLDGFFIAPSQLRQYPLSTLMKKVCRKLKLPV